MSVRDIVQAAAGVSTGNPNAWDISKAYYDVGSAAGDLSTIVFNASNQAIQSQDLLPTDLFFNPDGLTLFMIGQTNDRVYEFTLASPWGANDPMTYVRNFSVSSQENAPTGLAFKPDGTKMYIVGTTNDTVYQYSLSTAWNLSTASYDSVSKSVSAQDTSPQGLAFKSDGTKMYVVGGTGVDINEYDLSTPWDVSSATYSQNFSVSAQDSTPTGVSFALAGTKMYVVGDQNDSTYEYTLSTAWDISSASYVQSAVTTPSLNNIPITGIYVRENGENLFISGYNPTTSTAFMRGFVFVNGFSVLAQETAPQDLFFKDDGTKMYVLGSSGDDVNEYDLSTAWDVTTSSYVQNFSIGAQELTPTGLFFRSDGLKMYICGSNGDDVNEYTLSVAWDISTASYVQNFSVAAQETAPSGLSFKPDGTRMYMMGSTSDRVYQYALATSWDISTAALFVGNGAWNVGTGFYSNLSFLVSAQEATPRGMFFKTDGTVLYIVGTSGNVNQYSLSTAWKIDTASYVQNFSVTSQTTVPEGLFFKPDGTKMYIAESSTDSVLEYDLSTPWDISTSSYVQNFSVSAQELTPTGLFFRSDGLKMYICGSSGDDVNEYTLSVSWDVSTASYVQNFSVAGQETAPQDLFFKDDGTVMYIIGSSGDDINQYNLATAWDISTASFSLNFSVAGQDAAPTAMAFKTDGTKFYIAGSVADRVFEYNTGAFNVASQGQLVPTGLFFKPDGLKMYVCGSWIDMVEEYDLSVAWDISTASYSQNFPVAAQAVGPSGLFWRPDGGQFFITDNSNFDGVFSYLISEE